MKKYLSFILSILIIFSAMPFLGAIAGENVSKASATETQPQQKVADIYFIAGQSNASGCSDFYRNDKTTLNLSDEYAVKADTYINGFENVLYYGSSDFREIKMQTVIKIKNNSSRASRINTCMLIPPPYLPVSIQDDRISVLLFPEYVSRLGLPEIPVRK